MKTPTFKLFRSVLDLEDSLIPFAAAVCGRESSRSGVEYFTRKGQVAATRPLNLWDWTVISSALESWNRLEDICPTEELTITKVLLEAVVLAHHERWDSYGRPRLPGFRQLANFLLLNLSDGAVEKTTVAGLDERALVLLIGEYNLMCSFWSLILRDRGFVDDADTLLSAQCDDTSVDGRLEFLHFADRQACAFDQWMEKLARLN